MRPRSGARPRARSSRPSTPDGPCDTAPRYESPHPPRDRKGFPDWQSFAPPQRDRPAATVVYFCTAVCISHLLILSPHSVKNCSSAGAAPVIRSGLRECVAMLGRTVSAVDAPVCGKAAGPHGRTGPGTVIGRMSHLTSLTRSGGVSPEAGSRKPEAGHELCPARGGPSAPADTSPGAPAPHSPGASAVSSPPCFSFPRPAGGRSYTGGRGSPPAERPRRAALPAALAVLVLGALCLLGAVPAQAQTTPPEAPSNFGQPTNLVVTPDNAKLVVTWTSKRYAAVLREDGNWVQWKRQADSTWSTAAGASSPHTISGLTNDTTYDSRASAPPPTIR